MNIAFAGLHGTGKSTIAQQVANHFGFSFYSTGMAFRELAKDHSMDLEQFSTFVEDHPEIDKELDGKILNIAQLHEKYIFEGQLPVYMLGKHLDFAILLQCDEEVRIKRMAERDVHSFDQKKRETLMREESERQRFIELYTIDVMDPKTILNTFNLILDTTHLSIKNVVKVCIAALNEFFAGNQK
jgi:predicted cytidylate kinase